MESHIDWLTLTIKPENGDIDFNAIMHALEFRLLLKDLIDKMFRVPRVAHYAECLGYENITLCMPSYDRYREQGFMLRFSSQGLGFFCRYLDTYNITLKQWLTMFRDLCFHGFITRCTRLDYAMDDIARGDEKPLLTMRKVINCARKGEMCKKARVVDLVRGEGVKESDRFKTVDGCPLIGRTLNVGSRQSDVFCRFYDKLAEQLQTKKPVDKDITSWVRCEFEFKGSSAMAVLNAFLDYDDEHFSDYMRGVSNNYVSFIVRDNNNISRCPVKKWWTAFLFGTTKKFKLPKKIPARSAYARAKRGLNQYIAILYTLHKELGWIGVVKLFKKMINEKFDSNPMANLYKPELAENIREGRLDYERLNGFTTWLYSSPFGRKTYYLGINSFDRIHPLYLKFYDARHLKGWDLERHLAFMDGCEVLA